MSVAIENVTLATMLPVTEEIGSIEIGGVTIGEIINNRLAPLGGNFVVKGNFLPSKELLDKLSTFSAPLIQVKESDGTALLTWQRAAGMVVESVEKDAQSLVIRYPWDLIFALEEILGTLGSDEINGLVKPNVHWDGHVTLGEGSVLLPGVYIEGNVVIGKNCKIGPNCYIRGNTSIGDNCHIGQSVEVKNSLVMSGSSIGHLSYIGDSVICRKVNFGAGTIASNLRHDGKNHRSLVGGVLMDTRRRKFGTVIGANVHTGIHTSIYPGRKLYQDSSTLPGEIVSHDKFVS